MNTLKDNSKMNRNSKFYESACNTWFPPRSTWLQSYATNSIKIKVPHKWLN